MSRGRAHRPKLLLTGFGPFPNAPDNPTAALVEALACRNAEHFGAGAVAAVVLPTDYRRSWAILRRRYRAFAPDVVLHFGLSRRAEAITLEGTASKRVDAGRPDAAGFAPRSGVARRSGPERLHSTMPVAEVAAALADAGITARLSDDAGSYVCNATLYRSLLDRASAARLVGLVHVPMPGEGFPPATLEQAGVIAAQVCCRAAQMRGDAGS